MKKTVPLSKDWRATSHPKPSCTLLREFDPEAHGDLDVPDPYYGGERGFESVHDMVERACRTLLEHLRARHGL